MKIILTNPQHQVSRSKKRFRVLISGRRFGKTYLCISEIMKYASQVNQNIWYCAPTFKMARDICWLPLKQILHEFNWVDDINESNLSIKIRNTGLLPPGATEEDARVPRHWPILAENRFCFVNLPRYDILKNVESPLL